jgi:hypothetical protein
MALAQLLRAVAGMGHVLRGDVLAAVEAALVQQLRVRRGGAWARTCGRRSSTQG